jgi:hypothetical protein
MPCLERPNVLTKVWVVARQLQMGNGAARVAVEVDRGYHTATVSTVDRHGTRPAACHIGNPFLRCGCVGAAATIPVVRHVIVAIFSFSLHPPATRLTKPQHCRLSVVRSARAATVHVELASRGATASTPHRRARCMSPSWHHDHDDGGSDEATYIHACRVPVWPARLPDPTPSGREGTPPTTTTTSCPEWPVGVRDDVARGARVGPEGART